MMAVAMNSNRADDLQAQVIAQKAVRGVEQAADAGLAPFVARQQQRLGILHDRDPSLAALNLIQPEADEPWAVQRVERGHRHEVELEGVEQPCHEMAHVIGFAAARWRVEDAQAAGALPQPFQPCPFPVVEVVTVMKRQFLFAQVPYGRTERVTRMLGCMTG